MLMCSNVKGWLNRAVDSLMVLIIDSEKFCFISGPSLNIAGMDFSLLLVTVTFHQLFIKSY
jgi:hypothetical protein